MGYLENFRSFKPGFLHPSVVPSFAGNGANPRDYFIYHLRLFFLRPQRALVPEKRELFSHVAGLRAGTPTFVLSRYFLPIRIQNSIAVRNHSLLLRLSAQVVARTTRTFSLSRTIMRDKQNIGKNLKSLPYLLKMNKC
jgi:hypothetical protein